MPANAERRTWASLIEAFAIFAKYATEADIAAGTDQIYAGPDPAVVALVDRERLAELGWQPSEYENCFVWFV